MKKNILTEHKYDCFVVGCNHDPQSHQYNIQSSHTPGTSRAKKVHVTYKSTPTSTQLRPTLPPRDRSRHRGQGSHDIRWMNIETRAKRNIYYTPCSGHNVPCLVHGQRHIAGDDNRISDSPPIISSEIHV